jgi:predicted nucleotidyltransferase
MLNELDVIRDVTRRLTNAGLPYMLTGSLAMNYYSLPRMTRDVDFVVEAKAEDLDKIISGFERDYYLERSAVSRAISHERSFNSHERSFNMIHNEAFIKVDCIIRKASEYRQLEFSRRQQAEIQGVRVWMVSKEDLIISKLFWARDSHSELQLRDVKNLLASGYDVEYLEHWIRKLELSTLLQECLND